MLRWFGRLNIMHGVIVNEADSQANVTRHRKQGRFQERPSQN